VLILIGLALGIVLGLSFELLVLLYVAATISYSAGLKNVAVLDLGLVASFYVIRALAGGAATGIAISPWFLALTSAAAFFVVAGKRYSNHAGPDASSSDTSKVSYSQEYLRYVWTMGSGLAIAAYALWAFAQPHVRFEISWSEVSIAPFALAILRYALLLDAGKGGAPEDVVLSDRPLQILFAAWLIVYAIGVYAHG
jgi:decaprenyl-phosphate phosphoribosyltransferase